MSTEQRFLTQGEDSPTMLQTLALATLMSLAPAQGGDELKLTNARPTYGVMGPVRPDDKILPGDELWITFDIENITINQDTGEARYSMGFELLDAKGNLKYGKKPVEVPAPSFFGGTSLPAFAHAEIGSDTEPGQYTMVVKVTDLLAKPKKEAQLKKTFEVGPKDFGMVRVATFLNGTGNVAAPSIGVAGQFYFVNFYCIGFERTKSDKEKEPDLTFEMTILDEKGKPTLAKPLTAESSKGVAVSMAVVPMTLSLNLNRPGKFTIKIKATDKVAKKTAEVSFPLTVLESNSK